MPKPDPRILAATVAAAGGSLRSTLMVGDSDTDIATARAANVPIIAVDFGYTDTPVAALGPSRLISRYDELLFAVTDMIKGAPLVASEP